MRRIKELLLFVVPLLAICSLFLLTSCRGETEFQKAEHTYSQLGFSVGYKYPKGYKTISSDDDTYILIASNETEETSDWSIFMNIDDVNGFEFEEFKGEASKRASDIKQKDGVWTFVYDQPQEKTILVRWFECGKVLILRKANDFNYDDAFEIARSFTIDVWSEDLRCGE